MDLVCRWEEKRDFKRDVQPNFELEHFESTDSDLSAGIALAGHIPPDLTVFSPSYGKKARMHN